MSRIDSLDLSPRPVRRAPARKPVARKPRATRPDRLAQWATGGVALMAALSGLLNAYANSLHATLPWAGATIGVLIPVIVLVLGKVAGLVHRRGHTRPACLIGAVGAGLLFLSVWHCATSIALLTGSPVALALPMSVAIDCGLVACELALLLD